MKIIKQSLKMTIFCLTILISITVKSEEIKKDNITQTFYFNNIAIHNVENYGRGVPEEFKVIIQALEKSPQSNKPVLGKILWTITVDQFPMTKHDCLAADAQLCNEYEPLSFRGTKGACGSLCLVYGPQYLIFNEKKGLAYIGVDAGIGGSGGWPMMVFEANINTKKITRLSLDWGPTAANLSPSGIYLILYSNDIAVINTVTGEKFYLNEPNLTKAGKLQTVYTDYYNLKWLNDHTLQFTKAENLDKFFKEPPTYVVTKILDIKTRTAKTIG